MVDKPKRSRPPVLAHVRLAERAREFAGLTLNGLFTEIWKSNLWGAETSRSGLGSVDLPQVGSAQPALASRRVRDSLAR